MQIADRIIPDIDFIFASFLVLLFDLFGTFRGPGFPQTIKVRSIEPEAQPELALGRRYPVGFIALTCDRK